MTRIALVISGIILAVAIAFNIPTANAHNSFYDSGGGIQSPGTISVTPNPAMPGDTIIITHCAPDDHNIAIVETSGAPDPFLNSPPVLTSPSFTKYVDNSHTMPFVIPAGNCHDTIVKTDFPVPPSLEAGPWLYESDVDITGDNAADLNQVLFFDISFLVLPESIIGAFAVIAVPFAALMLYKYKHKH